MATGDLDVPIIGQLPAANPNSIAPMVTARPE